VAAAVLAADGALVVWLVPLAAFAGAFVGDLIMFGLGRWAGTRLVSATSRRGNGRAGALGHGVLARLGPRSGASSTAARTRPRLPDHPDPMGPAAQRLERPRSASSTRPAVTSTRSTTVPGAEARTVVPQGVRGSTQPGPSTRQ